MARNPSPLLRYPADEGWQEGQVSGNFRTMQRRITNAFRRSPYLLGVASGAVGTGSSTAETTLLSVAFPAGLMGPTGSLRITGLVTGTNANDTRTFRIRFGDATKGAGDPMVGGHGVTSPIVLNSSLLTAYIINVDAVDSQRAVFRSEVDDNAGDSSDITTTTTLTVDTDATPSGRATGQAIVVSLTGETANAADEVTGNLLIVEFLPRVAFS